MPNPPSWPTLGCWADKATTRITRQRQLVTQSPGSRCRQHASQHEEATTAYEKILARGPEPWEGHVEWAVSHLALARFYEGAGRMDDAPRIRESLRDVWKNADTDLPPVRELSAMLARK